MKTALNLPPPDINAHPALADADTRRRVRTLRLIAATQGGSSRGRLAAAELRIIENELKGAIRGAR